MTLVAEFLSAKNPPKCGRQLIWIGRECFFVFFPPSDPDPQDEINQIRNPGPHCPREIRTCRKLYPKERQILWMDESCTA